MLKKKDLKTITQTSNTRNYLKKKKLKQIEIKK